MSSSQVSKAHRKLTKKLLGERVVLWHNDYEGPRATVARFQDFKLILDAYVSYVVKGYVVCFDYGYCSILLLSYTTSSGAIGSFDLLLSYSAITIISIAQHIASY